MAEQAESNPGQSFASEYVALGHAIQTGVLYELELEHPGIGDTPVGRFIKHLRTGNNLRACDHAALAHLLIEKGVITTAEYEAALLKELRREKTDYETRLTEAMRQQPGTSPDLQIKLV